MTNMKPFKSYARATKNAAGKPILKVGNLYLVPETDDLIDIKLTEIELIGPRGHMAGNVTLDHLNRLGNANHAQANPKWSVSRIFG